MLIGTPVEHDGGGGGSHLVDRQQCIHTLGEALLKLHRWLYIKKGSNTLSVGLGGEVDLGGRGLI